MPSAALLLAVGAAFLCGVMARDQRLSAAVAARERAMLAEFPAIADLLALSVAAGEGPVAALERVDRTRTAPSPASCGCCSVRLPPARRSSPRWTTSPRAPASPLSPGSPRRSAVAIERGTPLVGVLHAQAADVREAGRRQLLETGARKEVSMMVPVVFLVLPVTVVFAFFPGVVGLQLTAPDHRNTAAETGRSR